MVVYSFHIFDRHAECIYSKRWSAIPTQATVKPTRPQSGEINPPNGEANPGGRKALSLEDDAKLIFGAVFSLRNMAARLGGEDNNFLTYRTKEYKLHYYETLTRLKFVMITDTKTNNLQLFLHQIWATLYVEYVVKNPLAPVEHARGVGVPNELFEMGLERFVATTLG